jgi:NAD-dependent SIR2 family protein deacetylase
MGNGTVKKKRKSGWDADEDDDSSSTKHIMKPDITFFGEALASKFDEFFIQDMQREDFDLLLIIGTSLKVRRLRELQSTHTSDLDLIGGARC